MSLTRFIRTRREALRNRRERQRALNSAATPGMRDELIYVAQRETIQPTR